MSPHQPNAGIDMLSCDHSIICHVSATQYNQIHDLPRWCTKVNHVMKKDYIVFQNYNRLRRLEIVCILVKCSYTSFIPDPNLWSSTRMSKFTQHPFAAIRNFEYETTCTPPID